MSGPARPGTPESGDSVDSPKSGIRDIDFRVVVNLQTDSQVDPFVRNVPITLVLHEWAERTPLPTDYTDGSGGVAFAFKADQFARIEVRVAGQLIVPASPIRQLYNVFFKYRRPTSASAHDILVDEPGAYRIGPALQTWTL